MKDVNNQNRSYMENQGGALSEQQKALEALKAELDEVADVAQKKSE
jgi:hypothetical protein